jgi:hypothetical protein
MKSNAVVGFGYGSLVACLAGAIACGTAPSDGAVGASAQEIIGGTPVSTDTLGAARFLYCPNGTSGCTFTVGSASWGCSGTMIADTWLLTAHHCVTPNEVMTGGTAVPAGDLLVTGPSGASSTAVAVFLHPTLDVALVELAGPLLNAAGQSLSTPIYTGPSAGLVGQSVYCQGFGIHAAAAGTGYGTLRSAVMTVAGASVGSLFFFPNAQGQSLAGGDSGAGCFLHAPGGASPNYVVSVHSYGDVAAPGLPPSDDEEVGADGFQSWAAGVIAASCSALTCYGAPNTECGTFADGCGGTLDCGKCTNGQSCSAGKCVGGGGPGGTFCRNCEATGGICTVNGRRETCVHE